MSLVCISVAGLVEAMEDAPDGQTTSRPVDVPAARPAAPRKEHPLVPALEAAREAEAAAKKLEDYIARFAKWDIVGGRGYAHSMQVKFRTKPMSVYMLFDKPHEGREVIYVEGQNGGKLLAHETGLASLIGTVSLEPDSPRALSESKHPITNFGMAKLVGGIIRQWEAETRFGECDVVEGEADLHGMKCRVLDASHPRPRRQFAFHKTRLYIDRASGLPVRVEQYAFPSRPGQKPPLVARYTYWDVRPNAGLADRDFDPDNPAYDF